MFCVPIAFSTFQVLIGDVILGQRPELLEVAAQPFSNVSAFVTDKEQTAVVGQSSRIRLDWYRWVRETLGNSSTLANYTVYQTYLDKAGNVVGPRQIVSSGLLFSRITLKTDPATNEFYVDIQDVLVVQGAEDADRAIYELEACVPQMDGSAQCSSSDITVYAIGQPPVLVIAGDEGDYSIKAPYYSSARPFSTYSVTKLKSFIICTYKIDINILSYSRT